MLLAWILVTLTTSQLVLWSSADQTLPMTPAQYVTMAKCSFVIHGEFTYQQAVAACETRNAMLGFFTSPSEEHTISYAIDWRLMPGFQRGSSWVGQLWLGVKRMGKCWAFDNPVLPNIPVPFTSFVNPTDSTSITDDPKQCVVLREAGWVAYSCNATINGVKQGAGALCTSLTRTAPHEPINGQGRNYCQNYLLPPSVSSTALPLVIKKNYFLVKSEMSFYEAQKFCWTKQGQLATARSFEEFEFMLEHLPFEIVDNRAWIGLSRSAGTSSFHWIDGSLNTCKSAFLPGEPANRYDCVAFDSDDERLGWRTARCSEPMNAVCEIFVIL